MQWRRCLPQILSPLKWGEPVNGLGRLRNRVYGAIVPSIQHRVAQDLDELVDRLLEEAAKIWRDDGWRRFDDREANCTIQIYRCSREAKRRELMYGLLLVQIEYVMPTRKMLIGTEDASGMSRPDIRVSVGEVGRIVECKRLSLGRGQPRSYVYDGIARFVAGTYDSGGDVEYVVGYLQADPVDEVVEAVNDHVRKHPTMGQLDVLSRDQVKPTGVAYRYGSRHRRNGTAPFEIRHYVLDVSLHR